MATEEQLDEDGLVIRNYVSMVLVVLPDGDFAEQTLRYARSSLYNVHVGTYSVAEQTEELIHGRLQDEFLVDAALDSVSMSDYSGLILVGGEGAVGLFDSPVVHELVRQADADGKMIGAFGHSVGILAGAGILKGRKVTGDRSIADRVRASGGKYTGRQLQEDKNLVTALDEAVGMRFGQALVQRVGI